MGVSVTVEIEQEVDMHEAFQSLSEDDQQLFFDQLNYLQPVDRLSQKLANAINAKDKRLINETIKTLCWEHGDTIVQCEVEVAS